MSRLYNLARPIIFALPAETAHGVAIRMMKIGLMPGVRPIDDPALSTRVLGLSFPTPIGLAAGFDKNADVPDAMLRQGFGFVEIGTVTPEPQDGNPKPRMFRLAEDKAVINRLGFNNQGLVVVRARLEKRRAAGRPGIVGVNVGANKDATDRVADYATMVRALAPVADYMTVNISSPNTPGLRALQSRGDLEVLLARVLAARAASGAKPAILLKIAPDLTPEDRADIAAVVLESGIDGLIVSNTTIDRPQDLRSPHAAETGGLSGAPLMGPSTEVLTQMYLLTKGKIPIIGVGGVANAATAYAKIRAGASLVQLYSALVYNGPDLAHRIAGELKGFMEADGFSHIAQAVGADYR